MDDPRARPVIRRSSRHGAAALPVSGVPKRGHPGEPGPGVDEAGQDDPSAKMLPQTSGPAGPRGYKGRRSRLLVTSCGCATTNCGQTAPSDFPTAGPPSTASPQSFHNLCTVSSTCTHDVDAAPADPPLRFRPVSPTPIYSQLRGERINADVPVTEAHPQEVDHPGKHRLPDGGPDPAAVFARPPIAGAARAAGCSWFTASEPVMHSTWQIQSAVATRRDGWTYPTGQPASSNQEAATGWGPHAALPPAAHARHEQPPPDISPRRPKQATTPQQPSGY